MKQLLLLLSVAFSLTMNAQTRHHFDNDRLMHHDIHESESLMNAERNSQEMPTPRKAEQNGNTLLCDSTVTYDADGNRTKKYEYTYDANGNLTSYALYQWSDGAWVVSSKSEYTYDANGNRIKKNYYKYFNGKWYLSSTTYYYYSDHSTDIEAVSSFNVSGFKSRKYLHNGHVIIEHGGKQYGIDGIEIR